MMRQRIVGAIVLISVGVVLWTLLFTGSADYALDRSTRIPDQPEIVRPDNRPAPVPSGITPASEPIVADAEASAGNTVSDPRPKLDPANGLPEAWVVAVATFSQRDNANSLKESLQKDGYKAYLQRFDGRDGDLFRVMVGPKFSRNFAERVKLAIEKDYKLEALLMRFEP